MMLPRWKHTLSPEHQGAVAQPDQESDVADVEIENGMGVSDPLFILSVMPILAQLV